MKNLWFFTLVAVLICSQATYAVVVDIPDANLEAVIRETIGKPEGDITDIDLQGITELDSGHDKNTPEGEKIVDLTGLEYCTNLTRLYLGWNQISDISSVSGLTKLTKLNLWYNQISDISAVSGLTKLTVLNLRYNHISDISAVSGLTKLMLLFLWDNHISDMESITNRGPNSSPAAQSSKECTRWCDSAIASPQSWPPK